MKQLSNVQLPKDMLGQLTKLEQTTAMFYNLDVPYILSNSYDYANFKNCRGLKDVSYMFGQDSYDADRQQRIPNLTGSIPYKFFYHGGDNKTIPGYKGAETVTYKYDENGEVINIEIENECDIEELNYHQPYSTISNMEYCFARCDCSYYTCTNINDRLENNPNYSPTN
jgi:hypothetical protein